MSHQEQSSGEEEHGNPWAKAALKAGSKLLRATHDPYGPQALAQHMRRSQSELQNQQERQRQRQRAAASSEPPSKGSEEQEGGASLLDPAQLLDQVLAGVKDSLREAMLSNLLGYVRFFSIRAAVGCVLLEGFKALMCRWSRRGPRQVHRVVVFVSEVALPTSFFGPVLGVTYGILSMLGKTPGSRQAPPDARSDTGGGGGAGGIDMPLEAGANAVTATTAGIITSVLETIGAAPAVAPGPGQPDVQGIIPASSPAATLAPLVGVPVKLSD